MADSPISLVEGKPRSEGSRRLLLPGLLLGIGLGGFVDGIVLHQILQWHHMISAEETVGTVAGLELNTLADGLFHAGAFVVTAAGLIVLFRALRDGTSLSGWVLAGWILAGWGLFNLVEGVVNHHLLAVHHVRPGPDRLEYDIGFLAFGAALVAGGWALAAWGGRRRTQPLAAAAEDHAEERRAA